MKILVDCIPLSVGGGVQVAIAFLTNLRERPNPTWKAVARTSLKTALPADLAADSRIQFLDKRSAFDVFRLRRDLQHVERVFTPDVVFTVFGPALFRARAPHLVGFALPHLLYDPDSDTLVRRGLEKMVDWMKRFALRRSDHFVVETQTVRKRLSERIGIDANKISVIPNSVNPIIMNYAGAVIQPDPGFAFLVPSAYYRHKNLEIIPAVAAAMRKLAPDLVFEFRLTLDPQSAAWRALAYQAETLGVASKIVTLNALQLDELARAYRAASAVFLPTLREASTAVYPESFAMERALVTSDLEFARELCGEAAMYIPPRDAAAIAERLIELISSPELRRRLTEAGKRQLTSSYLTPERKFAMQLALLCDLSSRVGRGKKSV